MTGLDCMSLTESTSILDLFTTNINVSSKILGFFRTLKYKNLKPKSI